MVVNNILGCRGIVSATSGATIAALCAIGPVRADLIVTDKFNPGAFGSFDYFFILNGVGQNPATDLTIDLDKFDFVPPLTLVSPDDNITATSAAGPPQSITIARNMGTGTFMVGDGFKINSGPNPAKIVGLTNRLTWSGTGGRPEPPFSKGPPAPPGLMKPNPKPAKVGALNVSGSGATPGSFVTIFQDDQPGVELGQAQVDSAGLFDVNLSSALNLEDYFIGVSMTNSDVPDGGVIVDDQTPVVPAPPTLAILLMALFATLGVVRLRRALP